MYMHIYIYITAHTYVYIAISLSIHPPREKFKHRHRVPGGLYGEVFQRQAEVDRLQNLGGRFGSFGKVSIPEAKLQNLLKTPKGRRCMTVPKQEQRSLHSCSTFQRSVSQVG